MKEKIAKLLTNQKFKDIVLKSVEQIYSIAGTIYSNPDEDMEKYLKENPDADRWYEAWWRTEEYEHDSFSAISKAFEKYISDELENPFIIYPEEIRTQFDSIFFPGGRGSPAMEGLDFESVYETFVQNVIQEQIQYRSSTLIPLCEIKNFVLNEKLESILAKKLEEGKDLNTSAIEIVCEVIAASNDMKNAILEINGIEFTGNIIPKQRFYPEKEHYYSIGFSGFMSTKAYEQIYIDIENISKSIIKSLSLITNSGILEELPSFDKEILFDRIWFLSLAIKLYFSDSSIKDSFERRIKNAVSLLCHADSQRADHISIALSVTAIEALLGESGKDISISEKISTNMSVLLEPNLEFRQQATQFMKDLYDERSRVLHGEKMQSSKEWLSKSRHLAATVLFTVVSHIECARKLETVPQKPKDLLKQLYESRFKKGRPIFSEEFDVYKYWRK